MAVNRQVYTQVGVTLDATGASNVAALYRQMFIDAGLMTEWHDNWNAGNNRNGTTHFRVLKLTQDSGKTYGVTYILFSFFYSYWEGRIWVYMTPGTGGWNATSHVPTGTQYLDYYSAPTSDLGYNGNGALILNIGAGDLRLVRYTSGNTTVFFSPGNSGLNSSWGPVILKSSIDAQPSWVDLSKVCLPPVFAVTTYYSGYGNGWRSMAFAWPYQFRRMVFPGRSVSGTAVDYFGNRLFTNHYTYSGYHANDGGGDLDISGAGATAAGAIRLPWADGTTMPGASAPWAPIITNLDMATPLNMKLPSDFGITTIPSMSRSANPLDRLNISANEVWEVIHSVSTPAAYNSMVFIARVT